VTAVNDVRYMMLALNLGQRGQGNVWPNPAVGCVIVKNGRIVGRGWTQKGGRPHAEVIALRQAGAQAHSATAYVTLEPCAHHGLTGPCAEALVTAGIRRCVVALTDPDPRVSGAGLAELKAAGIDVDLGCMSEQAKVAHRGFFIRLAKGRPRLTLKLAMSLDGRIATFTGESQWITSEASRRDVHGLRACHDAVLVGSGTVKADDPSLIARNLGQISQPVRIIASTDLDFVGAALKSSRDVAPLWLCHGPGATGKDAWLDDCDKLLEIPKVVNGQLNVVALLQALGVTGLTSVFCEGGGSLAASLLKADLVDDLIVYNAGLSIGADGLAGVAELGLDRLTDARRFTLVSCRKISSDVRQHWRALH
jgi:diaminohydroxyphosphoribosylaminopyrimidine deaminase/5-amino-6-(5-phosphoribosylamino)uracil reductase